MIASCSKMKIALLLNIIVGSITIRGTNGFMRACFYTNWSQFSPNVLARFTPAQIPAQLCTHIVFAFADVRSTSITPTEFNDIQMYARLNSLRSENPSLKLILAVGGWAAGGEKFARLVSSDGFMEQFASNLAAYLRRHSFDGVLIDWEYPRSGRRFSRLLQILASRFNREATSTDRPRLTLSAALEVNTTVARSLYEIDEIGRLLDFAYIMAYDLHGEWDPQPGALHHAALNPDISVFIGEWIAAGFPASKMVLGVTSFGRSFILASAPVGTGVGQRVTGGGTPGVISRTRGMLNFAEICINLQRRGWRRFWLGDQGVPIAFGNTSDGWQWVGYDDPQSMELKARFVRQENLAGVMLWSLDHDDHSNLCGIGPWPLLTTLARELPRISRRAPPSTTEQPATIPTTTVPVAVITDYRPQQGIDSPPVIDVTSLNSATIASQAASHQVVDSTPAPQAGADNQHSANSSSESDAVAAKHQTAASVSESQTKVEQHQRSDSDPETQAEAGLQTVSKTGDCQKKSSISEDPGYKQCKMSQTVGPSMTCPPNRGKPGDKYAFYLFCATGFFGIECHCLEGYFYNRCLSLCDLEQNFYKCPMIF